MNTAAVVLRQPRRLALSQLETETPGGSVGLITRHDGAVHAPVAYSAAFGGVACLKMILDWRTL